MALVFLYRGDEVVVATGLLGVGWLTDAFDGRVARSTAAPTRLGAWDLWFDVALAAGVAVGHLGFVESPWVAVGAVAAGVVLLGLAAWRRNPTPAMVFMATADVLAVRTAWLAGAPAGIVVVAVPLFILALHRHRFASTVVPAFIHGMAGLARGRRGSHAGVDTWARWRDGGGGRP